jgi:hypothetical protein
LAGIGLRFAATLGVDFDAVRVFGRAAVTRELFFVADFGAVARFAFAFVALEAAVRLFTEALLEARRAPEVDRLNPFVAGLLIW